MLCFSKESERFKRALIQATADVKLWNTSSAVKDAKDEGIANLVTAKYEVLKTGGYLLPSASMPNVSLGTEYQTPGSKGKAVSKGKAAAAFSLTANTGHFCTRRGGRACCRSTGNGREARESELAELGSNVSSYFKLLKMLVGVYLIAALLAIPLIAINLNGGNDGSTATNVLASTTAGNVAGLNGTALLLLPVAGLVNVGTVSVFYSLVDLAIILCAVAAYFWAKAFVVREDKQVQRLSKTLQDYTVYLPNVHPKTSAEDVAQWVQGVVRQEAARGALDVLQVIVDINKAQAANGTPSHSPVLPSRSTPHNLAAAFAVQHVSLVPSHQVLADSLASVGTLKARVLSHTGAVRAGAVHRAALKSKGGLLNQCLLRYALPSQAAAARELARLRTEELEKGLELDSLVVERIVGKAPSAVFPTAGAFVCFEHQAARSAFLTLAASRWPALQPLLHRHMLLRGLATTPQAPPSPAQLVYFNLHFSASQRWGKRLFSNAAALLVIVAAFGIILLTSITGQGFQRQLVPTDCSVRTLSTFVKSYNTRKSPKDEEQFLKSFPNDNFLMYCVCDSLPWAAMVAPAVSANPYTTHCTYQSCPRMSKLGLPAATSNANCVTLAAAATKVQVFQIVQSLVINVVNAALAACIRYLSQNEGHHSRSDLEVSVTFRVFLTKLFNTLLLTVLINMQLPVALPTGLYSDMTPGWYVGVGATFVQQMFIAAVVPHIPNALACLSTRSAWRNPALYTANLNVADLAAKLAGPAMDLPARASDVMLVVYITLVFLCNMPMMAVAGLLALLAAYWADKLSLLRLHSRPPFADSALIASFVEYLPAALLAHMGVAMWSLSGVQALATINAYVNPFASPAAPTASAAAAAARTLPNLTYARELGGWGGAGALLPADATAAFTHSASAAGGEGAFNLWQLLRRGFAAALVLLGGAERGSGRWHGEEGATAVTAAGGLLAAGGAVAWHPRQLQTTPTVTATVSVTATGSGSDTPTPTSSGSDSVTPSPSPSLAVSSSNSNTDTPTSIASPAASNTSSTTATPTSSVSPAVSSSSSTTATPTSTVSPAASSTSSNTATPTASPTFSSTASSTESNSATPTSSASPAVSSSSSNSLTSSPTLSPTASITSSNSATSTPSNSPAATSTSSNTKTSSTTLTPAATSTSSNTGTSSTTLTPAASSSGSNSSTTSPTSSPAASSTSTNTSSPTSTTSPAASSTSSLTPNSTSSLTPSPTPTSAPLNCPSCPISTNGCQCLSPCMLDLGLDGNSRSVCVIYSFSGSGIGRALQQQLGGGVEAEGGARRLQASSSDTPTPSASLTMGASPSITPTPSASLTLGSSPSITPTPTASLSLGSSPSNSESASLSSTLLPSATNSQSSASASNTPSTSLFPTPFPSVSFSDSSTASLTGTPTPSRTPSGVPSPQAPSSLLSGGACSFFAPYLSYSPTLQGLVDTCSRPNYGFSNSGCNCSSPPALTPLISASTLTCAVDPLCPAAYLSAASPSGWWDYANAPGSVKPTGPVLSYCDINFFRAECQNSSIPLAADVRKLNALLAVPGSNYTFSFLDVTFAKTLAGGGAGSTGSGRSSGMGVPGSGSLSVDVTRATATSALPLLAALGLSGTLFALGAWAVALKAAASLLYAALCTRTVKRATLKQAEDSAIPRPVAKGQRTYTVPLSLALRCVPGAYRGVPLVLAGGGTYSVRAQPHVYKALNLLAVLKDAHGDLQPAHLALAEGDGVFGAEAPGLLFIVPYFWEEPGPHEDRQRALLKEKKVRGPKGERAVAEGYKLRLRRWVMDCMAWRLQRGGRGSSSSSNGGGGGAAGRLLDERLQKPQLWEGFVWEDSAESRKAFSRSGSGSGGGSRRGYSLSAMEGGGVEEEEEEEAAPSPPTSKPTKAAFESFADYSRREKEKSARR